MLSRIARKFVPLGRGLARRMPGLANSSLGRAAKAAVRELVYPSTQTAWRRSLPSSPSPSPSPSPQVEVVPEPPVKKRKPRDPDEVAGLTSEFIGLASDRTCDIVLCCAFAGRHRLLARVIAESLASEASVRWVLTGSTEEDVQFIRTMAERDSRVTGFTCPNRPLGRKWQTCVRKAVEVFDYDLCCIVGSDDILSAKLLDTIAHRHAIASEAVGEGEHMPSIYCALEWIVWNVGTKSNHSPNIVRCSYRLQSAFQPLGAGRFYTRRFLDSCGGTIFDSTLDRLLDDRGSQRIIDQGASVEYFSIEDGPLISVKGDWGQMNAFDAFLEADTLVLDEFSFAGQALLRESLSSATFRFLAKQDRMSPQFNFSKIPTGTEPDESTPAS